MDPAPLTSVEVHLLRYLYSHFVECRLDNVNGGLHIVRMGRALDEPTQLASRYFLMGF
jgi:hypothetical protein